MRHHALPLLLPLLLMTFACDEKIPDIVTATPSLPIPQFEDRSAESGLTHPIVVGNPVKDHLVETTGTGIAVGDFDDDGDEDLYVVTAQSRDDWLAGRRPQHNRLYRNRGDGTYDEVAVEAGVALAAWGQGAYFVDADDDGDLDLFVTNWGPNVFFRNEGDGTFLDATEETGLGGSVDAWSTSAMFADLDADGDLDLYVVNYCEYDLHNPPGGGSRVLWKGIAVVRGPHGLVAQPDALFRNDDGRFVDVSEEAGIHAGAVARYGLGIVAADYDGDGDTDIYVANDSQPNYLWRNEGGLRFVDVATRAGVATNEDAKEQAGMGTDAADYDGDGQIDLVVTNFSHDWNTLYRNQGGLLFRDETFSAGLQDSYLKLVWGVKFLDVNDDRHIDLFVANGHVYPDVDTHAHLNSSFRQVNTLYLNQGAGIFINASEDAGAGLRVKESSRGLAVTDADGDGDLDLVIANMGRPPTLLIQKRGESATQHSLDLDLRSRGKNRFAVGSTVVVTVDGTTDLLLQNPFNSYLSQSRYPIHVGMGTATIAERIVIRWPSGHTETLESVASGNRYLIIEGEGIVEQIPHKKEAS